MLKSKKNAKQKVMNQELNWECALHILKKGKM